MTSLNPRDTYAFLQPESAKSREEKKTILVSYSVDPEEDANVPYQVSLATTLSPAGVQNLHLQDPSLALSIVCLSETPYNAKDQQFLRKHNLPGWTGYDPTEIFKSRVEALVGHSNTTRLRLVDDKTLKSVCPDDEDNKQRGKYRLIEVDETEDLRFKLDPETVCRTPEFRLDKPVVPSHL
jgi:hypothetical protein